MTMMILREWPRRLIHSVSQVVQNGGEVYYRVSTIMNEEELFPMMMFEPINHKYRLLDVVEKDNKILLCDISSSTIPIVSASSLLAYSKGLPTRWRPPRELADHQYEYYFQLLGEVFTYYFATLKLVKTTSIPMLYKERDERFRYIQETTLGIKKKNIKNVTHVIPGYLMDRLEEQVIHSGGGGGGGCDFIVRNGGKEGAKDRRRLRDLFFHLLDHDTINKHCPGLLSFVLNKKDEEEEEEEDEEEEVVVQEEEEEEVVEERLLENDFIHYIYTKASEDGTWFHDAIERKIKGQDHDNFFLWRHKEDEWCIDVIQKELLVEEGGGGKVKVVGMEVNLGSLDHMICGRADILFSLGKKKEEQEQEQVVFVGDWKHAYGLLDDLTYRLQTGDAKHESFKGPGKMFGLSLSRTVVLHKTTQSSNLYKYAYQSGTYRKLIELTGTKTFNYVYLILIHPCLVTKHGKGEFIMIEINLNELKVDRVSGSVYKLIEDVFVSRAKEVIMNGIEAGNEE